MEVARADSSQKQEAGLTDLRALAVPLTRGGHLPGPPVDARKGGQYWALSVLCFFLHVLAIV